MQVMYTLPLVSTIRRFVHSKTKEQVNLMKRIHKDDKSLFGELLETKKEKRARERREKKLAAKEKSEVNLATNKKSVDTEIHYLGIPKHKTLTKLKFLPPPFESANITKICKKLSDDIVNLEIINASKYSTEIENLVETVPNPKNLKEQKNSMETISGVKNSEIVNDADNSQPEIVSDWNENKELAFPSDILINKMTSFSYLDASKKEIEIPEGRKPISISPHSDKSKLPIPSVTRILNKTMSAESKSNLELWKQRMILELGDEGFLKYSQELLLYGKQFHSSIQNYLIQDPFEVPSTVEKSWESVQHVLKEVTNVQAIESHVVHSKLYYRGIVDCVAVYRGNLCVIDWKKSDKPKNSIGDTFDAPIQAASYVGALNSDRNYDFQIKNAVVVVGYTNGDPASVHEINPTLLDRYWKLWLRRLQKYYLELKSPE